MELEQLKGIWTSLDNRMQQQEGIKLVIIREMLINKSDKALSRIINYSYFGLILFVIATPLLIWFQVLASGLFKIVISAMILFFMIAIVLGIIQIAKLHRINFALPINKNIRQIEELNIFNKRFSLISYLIGFVIVVVVIVIGWVNNGHIEPWRWIVLLAGIFAGIIGGVWEYKRIYRRNFESILQSLEELKELEEPEAVS